MFSFLHRTWLLWLRLSLSKSPGLSPPVRHLPSPPPRSVTSCPPIKSWERRAQTRQMDKVGRGGRIADCWTHIYTHTHKRKKRDIQLLTDWPFHTAALHGYRLFHRGAAHFVPRHECGFIQACSGARTPTVLSAGENQQEQTRTDQTGAGAGGDRLQDGQNLH